MTAEKRAELYMVSAHMGTIALVGLLAAVLFEWPDLVRGLFVGVLLVGVVPLFWRRLRDEYIEGLWNRGTSFAFVAVILWFLLAPFAEGVFDGLVGNERGLDLPQTGAAIFALAGFYTGFQLERLRGAV